MTRRGGRLFSISSPRSCQQSSSINIGTGDCQEGKKKYLRFRALSRQFPTGCVRSPAGKLEPRAERALASRRKSGLRWVSASSMARRAVACLPAWRISASWSEDPKVNEFIVRYPPNSLALRCGTMTGSAVALSTRRPRFRPPYSGDTSSYFLVDCSSPITRLRTDRDDFDRLLPLYHFVEGKNTCPNVGKREEKFHFKPGCTVHAWL